MNKNRGICRQNREKAERVVCRMIQFRAGGEYPILSALAILSSVKARSLLKNRYVNRGFAGGKIDVGVTADGTFQGSH